MCDGPDTHAGAGTLACRKDVVQPGVLRTGLGCGAVATAYLKIRETNIATPQQTETIANWMRSVAEQTIGYYAAHERVGLGDSQNNHLYWARGRACLDWRSGEQSEGFRLGEGHV